MRICYITTMAPIGSGETFVLEEVSAMEKLGHEVLIVPLRPGIGKNESDYSVWALRAHSLKTYLFALLSFVRHPLKSLRSIFSMLFFANGFKKALKNLAFVPKALATARYLLKLEKENSIDFIHAHWLSTASSMGYIVAEITGIPFGVTGHRWDVYENNATAQKAKKAAFIRLIDHKGQEVVRQQVRAQEREKVKLVYMGAKIPAQYSVLSSLPEIFSVCMPANFVPIKGHQYVVEAFSILKQRGIKHIHCNMVGDGETAEQMYRMVLDLGLEDTVHMHGRIDHATLMQRYTQHLEQCVLLPSVDLGNGEHEGIPVALMEAMARGVPVISTETGGILELLHGACGHMVKQKDARDIADALELLYQENDYRKMLIVNGRARVEEEFDIMKNCKKLSALMEEALP